jgi:CheY-like chemotaxis protein
LFNSSVTVLIADDDPDIRLMLRTALELDGYRVLEAGDGETAWELIAAHRPAVVVTNVQMPVIDGLELSALVKANGYDTNVIVFTAPMAIEKEAIEKGTRLPAADTLQALLEEVRRLSATR